MGIYDAVIAIQRGAGRFNMVDPPEPAAVFNIGMLAGHNQSHEVALAFGRFEQCSVKNSDAARCAMPGVRQVQRFHVSQPRRTRQGIRSISTMKVTMIRGNARKSAARLGAPSPTTRVPRRIA